MSWIAVAHEVLKQAEVVALVAQSISSAVAQHVGPNTAQPCAFAGFADEVIDGVARHRLPPLGAEKTRSGDEALLGIGVSRHKRLAVLQRIQRGDAVSFSEPMWLAPHHVDKQYFAMLPAGAAELSAEEAVELARVFGKNGELRAERLS